MGDHHALGPAGRTRTCTSRTPGCPRWTPARGRWPGSAERSSSIEDQARGPRHRPASARWVTTTSAPRVRQQVRQPVGRMLRVERHVRPARLHHTEQRHEHVHTGLDTHARRPTRSPRRRARRWCASRFAAAFSSRVAWSPSRPRRRSPARPAIRATAASNSSPSVVARHVERRVVPPVQHECPLGRGQDVHIGQTDGRVGHHPVQDRQHPVEVAGGGRLVEQVGRVLQLQLQRVRPVDAVQRQVELAEVVVRGRPAPRRARAAASCSSSTSTSWNSTWNSGLRPGSRSGATAATTSSNDTSALPSAPSTAPRVRSSSSANVGSPRQVGRDRHGVREQPQQVLGLRLLAAGRQRPDRERVLPRAPAEHHLERREHQTEHRDAAVPGQRAHAGGQPPAGSVAGDVAATGRTAAAGAAGRSAAAAPAGSRRARRASGPAAPAAAGPAIRLGLPARVVRVLDRQRRAGPAARSVHCAPSTARSARGQHRADQPSLTRWCMFSSSRCSLGAEPEQPSPGTPARGRGRTGVRSSRDRPARSAARARPPRRPSSSTGRGSAITCTGSGAPGERRAQDLVAPHDQVVDGVRGARPDPAGRATTGRGARCRARCRRGTGRPPTARAAPARAAPGRPAAAAGWRRPRGRARREGGRRAARAGPRTARRRLRSWTASCR